MLNGIVILHKPLLGDTPHFLDCLVLSDDLLDRDLVDYFPLLIFYPSSLKGDFLCLTVN